MDAARYRANTPAVAHEAIDGEVMIIHLARGHYYNLAGSGAAIWLALTGGASLARVLAAASPELGDAVRAFVAALVEDELLVTDGAANGEGAVASIDGAPRLQKFTDMEDMLALDPIHEVGEAGWPHRKE